MSDTRYRAYVIYGGQWVHGRSSPGLVPGMWVYGRSSWHYDYAAARSEGHATCKPEEREFIGVVTDGPDSSDFERILLRSLTKTGGVE